MPDLPDLLNPERIATELLLLRRQRSLHGLDLATVEIPLLTQLTHLDSVDPATARIQLFEELTRAADALPEPQSTIVLIAYGITDPSPLLKDRLAHAGKVVDRDARTVRRWLTAAESMLAQSLIDRFTREDGHDGAPRGWFITEYETRLELRASPVFISRRTVRVTAPRLRILVESIAVPRVPDAEPEFTGIAGGRVIDVTRTSASVYQVSYELDRDLAAGESYELVSSVRMGSLARMRAMSVMVPVRPCRRYISEVAFGNPPAAGRVWRLNGVPLTVLDDRPTRGDVNVTPAMVVRENFEHLRPGLAYGVRWEWTESLVDSVGDFEASDFPRL